MEALLILADAIGNAIARAYHRIAYKNSPER